MHDRHPMTPDEFARRMRDIHKSDDLEGTHSMADALLCEVLASLGYEEGVNVFLNEDKWYA